MTSYLNVYSISLCKFMISDYTKQANDEEKSARWRELCRCSRADWMQRLEDAVAA